MENEIEKAKKERNKILSQEGKLSHLQKDYYQGLEKDSYEIKLSEKQKIEFKINQDEILKQRIIDWTNRVCDKLMIPKNQNRTFQDNLTQCVEVLKGKRKSSK